MQRAACLLGLLVSYMPLAPSIGHLLAVSVISRSRGRSSSAPGASARRRCQSYERRGAQIHTREILQRRQRRRWPPPDRQYVWPRPRPSSSSAAFDVIERHGAVRPADGAAQLQSFAADPLHGVRGPDAGAAPPQTARCRRRPTAGGRTRITRSWRLLFETTRSGARKLGARDEWNKAVGAKAATGSAGCATSTVGPVRAFRCFRRISCLRGRRRPDAYRSRPSSPRASVFAEADALTAQKTRDELERRLRAREAEVARRDRDRPRGRGARAASRH